MEAKFDLEYHIEFNAKEKRPFFKDSELRERIEDIFHRIAKEQRVIIKALAVQPEHVHMHISVMPDFNLSRFMQFIKGKSSYLIRKECPRIKDLTHGSLWSKANFVRTTGPVTSWKIDRYINSQK